MAQYTERLWTQTKDTEQLTFVAGVDLPYRELVKETGPNTNIVIVATTTDAIGYVLSPKGALAGEKVDIQMIDRAGGGGGGGAVNSVTGLAPNVIVDNTDPANPIVAAGTESWEFSGIITTPTLSNIQNDYTQAGMADASTVRVDGNIFDPPFFTGFSGGTSGRFLILENLGDTPIYLLHDDTNSLAENRILIPGFSVPGQQLSIQINQTIYFHYDSIVQRWRMSYKAVQSVVDSGNTVVTVDNTDPVNPVVGFNGVYVNAPITGNGTAFSPLTVSAVTDVLINKTLFVDPNYGDDATAIPDSLVFKYKTFDAALAAWTSEYVIHLFPGIHTMANAYSLGDVMQIYIETGATLNIDATAGFDIEPAQRLHIDGYGVIGLSNTLYRNSSPSDAIPAEAHIKCKRFEAISGFVDIGDNASMIYSIEVDGIYDCGVNVSSGGWCKGYVATDLITSSVVSVCSLRALSSNNGPTKYTDYGQRFVTLKGRTRPNAVVLNEVQVGNLVFTQVDDQETYKTKVELYADFVSTDGFCMNLGNGIVNWYGDLYHSKSNTAGNEVPFIYCDQTVTDDAYGPNFTHVRGTMVSTTHPSYAGSQNNEIAAIRCFGKFTFNGKYQNSGENTGLGAWPIIDFTNQNNPLYTGSTEIILNGEFKNLFKDAAPINIEDIGNANHTYRLTVKEAYIVTDEDGETITSNVAMPIYVQDSLSMNVNYNPSIFDGISTARTIVDRNVTVDVPEYGV